jgi:hypothetical protein
LCHLCVVSLSASCFQSQMNRRLVLLALVLPTILSAPPASCRRTNVEPVPTRLSREEFAHLVDQLSEEDGYFWSNNYISNETSYLHALGSLNQLGVKNGVYVGVGPNQNFSYIADIQPRLAFVIDIRRDNMLEHLLFKLLMERAETRQEYLSFLTGRPIHGPPLDENATIEELVQSIEQTKSDETFFRRHLLDVLHTLRSWPELGLDLSDYHDIERIYWEFFRQGLDIKYDSWRSFFFPTFKEFLLETDLESRHRNWLASAESFQFVRDLQKRNLIIPAVGDFAGEHAFRQLGSILKSRGETVSAVYVSNVEFYLFRQRRWWRFVDNMRHLPVNEKSVFIRAYANLHRPHPLMVGNHITVTLVQNIERFLENADRGVYRNLWDVVTTDYIHP